LDRNDYNTTRCALIKIYVYNEKVENFVLSLFHHEEELFFTRGTSFLIASASLIIKRELKSIINMTLIKKIILSRVLLSLSFIFVKVQEP
jgi:hypothetical protein